MSGCNNQKKESSFLYEAMFEFVRAAIFETEPVIKNKNIDWDRLMDVSAEQGLLAWVWDGVCKLPIGDYLSQQQRINWGLSVQVLWDCYEKQHSVLLKLINECRVNNIRVLLLKGIGLSTLYPKPKSRPCGDIDIYLFGDYEKGNKLFARGNCSKGIKDLGFYYNGVYIENHHTLIYTNTKKRKIANNYIQKSLSDIRECEDGYYVLPEVANVVYLLLHTLSHMDSEYVVSIRSVMDFGMFVYKNRMILKKNKYCIGTLCELGLVKPFCLLVSISEYYLKVQFDELKPTKIPSKDIRRAISLIENKESKYQYEENDSLLFHWKESVRRHFQIRWMYKYIPRSFGEHVISSLRREASLIVRKVFSIPSQISIWNFFKNTFSYEKVR